LCSIKAGRQEGLKAGWLVHRIQSMQHYVATTPNLLYSLIASRMFVPPCCLDDILRCGVYGTFAMACNDTRGR
jgi:hypothetical protein